MSDSSQSSYDLLIKNITTYVFSYTVTSSLAWRRVRVALLDSLGCALEGVPACSSFIGPIVPGTIVPNGFPLPGTPYVLDPLKAAFDLGSMIRYLDHSDAMPGAEWGHPSDNIGAILPMTDWLSRSGSGKITMKELLEAIIKAYEIQGVLQRKNAFNEVGIDHVILVKIASTAVLSKLIGLSFDQTCAAISQVFADGQPLRVYRQSPNTSPRKGWAAGDACMRAVHLVLMTKSGQPGLPTVLTAPNCGFYAASFRGRELDLSVPFGNRIVENHFIKLVAAEGHAISALEAALTLSKQLQGQVANIKAIDIRTHRAAMIIINKTGALHNAADRDHCMQYVVAVALLKGDWVEARDYEDGSEWACSQEVDSLRQKITMKEDLQFTADYHDDKVRTAASGLTVTLQDGTVLDEVVVGRPRGHPWREDTIPNTRTKFINICSSKLKDPDMVWEKFMDEDIKEVGHVEVKDWMDGWKKQEF